MRKLWRKAKSAAASVKDAGRKTALAARTLGRNKVIQKEMSLREDWWNSPALKVEMSLLVEDVLRVLFPQVLRRIILNGEMTDGLGRLLLGILAYLRTKRPPGPGAV